MKLCFLVHSKKLNHIYMKKTTIMIAIITTAIISSAFTVFAEHVIGPHFPDVEEGAYYEDAVYNMRYKGVISGYENGDFGPDDPVTRGQVATMLDRYDQNLTGQVVGSEGRGVDDLIWIVCAGITAEDMTGNTYLGLTVEESQEMLDKLCAIQ